MPTENIITGNPGLIGLPFHIYRTSSDYSYCTILAVEPAGAWIDRAERIRLAQTVGTKDEFWVNIPDAELLDRSFRKTLKKTHDAIKCLDRRLVYLRGRPPRAGGAAGFDQTEISALSIAIGALFARKTHIEAILDAVRSMSTGAHKTQPDNVPEGCLSKLVSGIKRFSVHGKRGHARVAACRKVAPHA